MPSEYSEAVLAMLPIGPHIIDLDDTLRQRTVHAKGYLDLPETHDLREACAYDIRVEVETRDESKGNHTTVYEMRKAKGDIGWRRVVSTTDPTHKTRWPNSIGKWFAGDDAFEAPNPAGILLPVLWLEEPFGGDYWCNLRRLDQVTELTDPATGELAYRTDTLELVKAANLGAWISELLPAAGYEGKSFRQAAADLREEFSAPATGPAYQQQMRITRTDGPVILTADRESTPLTATFTPAETRNIESVEGYLTYIEKLMKDPAVRDELAAQLQSIRTWREEYDDTE